MKSSHPDQLPCLLFANSKGEIQDFPDLTMAGRSAYQFHSPNLGDLIPLPEGSELFVLPGRLPIGFDPTDGQAARLHENPSNPADGIQAVAAFVAPAHTSVLLPAFEKGHDALHDVGEVGDGREAEKACGSFDAVNGAKEAVQKRRVVGVGLQCDQIGFKSFQMFVGLLDKEAHHLNFFVAHN